jgi:purine nucleosidase
MTTPRMRVISDNDYGGDPDGLVQLAHHLLSPSVDLRAVIGSHLSTDDPFDPSDRQATNAAAAARSVVDALGLTGGVEVMAGSEVGLTDASTPIRSAAAERIVAEAMREDTALPLYVVCGAGLTEIASAWLIEPRIAARLTVVWIGGAEYPGLAVPPPGSPAVEYNTNIDVVAAQVVFNDSDLPMWQVPRDAYRQTLLSDVELRRRIRPHGAIGELLFTSIDRVNRMGEQHGFSLGETYIYGDSPLVLLTALQSSFEPDPSSSDWTTRPAPHVHADGSLDFTAPGRDVRVFTRLDVRLLFDDLFLKLEEHGQRAG